MNRILRRGAIGLAGVLLAGCGASPAPDLLPQACPLPAIALPTEPPTEATEVPCSQRSDPRVATEMSDDGIQLMSLLGLPPGRYALPATSTPTTLVVMFHGHNNDSCSWRNHMRAVAAHGGVAVAMNYTGQSDRDVPGFGFIENYGWFVRSGAADSILAARYFLQRYPSITTVFNFGASMGGNVSGYAIYVKDAARADCSPLWDYWVVTEGVHNLTEEYTGIRAVAQQPGDPGLQKTAAQAQQEIEEENGGTLEQVPEAYSEITSLQHVGEMTSLKGAVLVHGATDQTVPFDQSRQMTQSLQANGVPAHLFTVTPSDHAWEGSSTLQVMKVGVDELLRLMDGGTVTSGETPVAGP